MELKNIYVDGFRNIHDTLITLDRITSILALNNYGKSNLFNAICFGKKFISNSKKSKEKLMRYTQGIPINKYTEDKVFKFGIDFYITDEDDKISAKYEYSFDWIKDDESGAKIKDEVLKIKREDDKKYTTVVNRNYDKCFYRKSKTGRTDINLIVLENELAINKLMEIENVYYKKIINELNNIKFEYNSFFEVEDLFDAVYITDRRENKLKLLDNGDNICEVIYNLKQLNKNKYELLINSFKKLVPSVEEIEPYCLDFDNLEIGAKGVSRINVGSLKDIEKPFTIPDTYYNIKIKEKNNNQMTPIKFLSSGSKRIFLLLAACLLADENNISLIMFEELENSIHPYLFNRVLMILDQLGCKCKFLISSHSPYLIQYMNLDKVYLGIPNDEGIANFKKLNKKSQKSIMKLARENDLSTGDYIFELLIDSIGDDEVFDGLLE
ncbi:AAA family ATPase [Clostridium perfringens]|uniref:AAA family ATPase n=1 Tax=Clostridium perfringens TaxID=1502 RepID=UPI001ABA30DE|nr:AAA family ATPase [Clostridium perfringens]MBO3313785.1 AAA family ATPase [Clostridium perfringens]